MTTPGSQGDAIARMARQHQRPTADAPQLDRPAQPNDPAVEVDPYHPIRPTVTDRARVRRLVNRSRRALGIDPLPELDELNPTTDPEHP